MKYAEKLRKFADYLDRHPELSERFDGRYEYPSNYIYTDDWDDFQAVIKNLGGFEKSGSGGSLKAAHTGRDPETDETMYYVSVSVTGACTSTPKTDELGNPVMRKKGKYIETDEYEPVMEWKCPEVWSS